MLLIIFSIFQKIGTYFNFNLKILILIFTFEVYITLWFLYLVSLLCIYKYFQWLLKLNIQGKITVLYTNGGYGDFKILNNGRLKKSDH